MDEDLEHKKAIQEFEKLEDLPPATVTLPLSAIWLLICQLQLVLRLPINTGQIAEDTRDIAKQLQRCFDWSPELKKALERGWNPEHDVDISGDLTTKLQLSKSTILHLFLTLKMACQELGESSGIATDQDWYELCWLKARQKMETLTLQEKEQLIKTAIEFDKSPDELE